MWFGTFVQTALIKGTFRYKAKDGFLIRAMRFENKQHSFKPLISPHQTGLESFGGGFLLKV